MDASSCCWLIVIEFLSVFILFVVALRHILKLVLLAYVDFSCLASKNLVNSVFLTCN